MLRILLKFSQDKSGATAIEYGLICALIFIAIIIGVQGVGSKTQNMFNNIQNNV